MISPSPQLKAAVGYPKFRNDRHVILLLDAHYHLGRECEHALTQLGHTVILVPINDNVPLLVETLLSQLVQTRADGVMAVNHIGFDAGGHLANLLSALQIPVAVWYVDSPQFVLRSASFPAPDVTSVFVWEKTLIGPLRSLGAQDVHYLPLATDPEKFRNESAVGGADTRYPMCFVGDSMATAQQKFRKRLKPQQQKQAKTIADRLVAAQRSDTHINVLMPDPTGSTATNWDTIALATWEATSRYRLHLLRAISEARQSDLHLFGDVGWKKLLPKVHLHGPVNYGAPLAQVYRCATINLNATSLQMPTAVNQRLFDVPMAGGFVLSDAQQDAQTLFDSPTEVALYGSRDEFVDLATYYEKNDAQRQSIITRARQRILAEHTYIHRCRQLTATWAQRWR